jgi:medium-chain acyl-[acyl-carrier-protein] hydrolase
MQSTSRRSSWFQYWHPKPQARLRLFCFPYAGGSALTYRSWFRYCPEEVEVCPIQLPGRENRLLEDPFTRISPLVECLAEALAPHLSLPFAFFGHSMGAIISFELARTLQRHLPPLRPVHLYVSGYPAPRQLDPELPVYNLPLPLFLARLRNLQGTPEEILQNEELLQLLLPALRADFEVSETYQYTPGPPLPCPITVFCGRQDIEAPPSSVSGWEQQTSRPCRFHFFQGGHFFVHHEQKSVLDALTPELLEDITSAAGTLR